MEGSSVNFYQILLINILITCMIMLYSGFYKREEETVLSFFTIDEVDQMIEKKVKEEREKMVELEQEKFIEIEKDEIKIEENEEKPERRKAVLMVTFMRSGSTFLGEMFNNHDDAFYVFEPLHPLSKLGFSKSGLEDRFEILTDNLNCNFREQYDITIPWRSFKGEEMPLEESLDKKGDFVFRSKHRRLCAPPFCGRDFSKSLHQCNEECGLVDLSLASRVCRPLVSAVKTIRFVEVELLQKMAEESNLDLKIIFLARDPRGILESRVKIYQNFDTAPYVADKKNLKAVNDVCLRTHGILETIKGSEWLRERSLVLRYEDLAMEPKKKGAEILEFSGLEITPKIISWIEENTSSKTSDSGTYDTSRDSKKTALAWRSILDYTSISKIQSKCVRNMDLLGYKQMRENDADADVLGEMDFAFRK